MNSQEKIRSKSRKSPSLVKDAVSQEDGKPTEKTQVKDEREELDFMFDAEMEELNINKKSFTKWDSDSDEDEITDDDIRKIIIVTQVIKKLFSNSILMKSPEKFSCEPDLAFQSCLWLC